MGSAAGWPAHTSVKESRDVIRDVLRRVRRALPSACAAPARRGRGRGHARGRCRPHGRRGEHACRGGGRAGARVLDGSAVLGARLYARGRPRPHRPCPVARGACGRSGSGSMWETARPRAWRRAWAFAMCAATEGVDVPPFGRGARRGPSCGSNLAAAPAEEELARPCAGAARRRPRAGALPEHHRTGQARTRDGCSRWATTSARSCASSATAPILPLRWTAARPRIMASMVPDGALVSLCDERYLEVFAPGAAYEGLDPGRYELWAYGADASPLATGAIAPARGLHHRPPSVRGTSIRWKRTTRCSAHGGDRVTISSAAGYTADSMPPGRSSGSSASTTRRRWACWRSFPRRAAAAMRKRSRRPSSTRLWRQGVSRTATWALDNEASKALAAQVGASADRHRPMLVWHAAAPLAGPAAEPSSTEAAPGAPRGARVEATPGLSARAVGMRRERYNGRRSTSQPAAAGPNNKDVLLWHRSKRATAGR